MDVGITRIVKWRCTNFWVIACQPLKNRIDYNWTLLFFILLTAKESWLIDFEDAWLSCVLSLLSSIFFISDEYDGDDETVKIKSISCKFKF